MKKNKIILLFMLAAISSCTTNESAKEGKVFLNDFDHMIPWNESSNNIATVIRGQAHSGNYLCRVDSMTPFGYFFKAKLSQLSDNKIKKVKTSVWVKIKNMNALGYVVIALDSAGKVFHWQGLAIEKEIRTPNEWVNLNVEVNLDSLKLSNKPWLTLGSYVWSRGNEQILSDDLEVTILD